MNSPLAVLLTDEQLAELARQVVERLDSKPEEDGWYDTRAAAAYLGVHPDTLRAAAAKREIKFEQEGPNCKLWFRRFDMAAWRGGGGVK